MTITSRLFRFSSLTILIMLGSVISGQPKIAAQSCDNLFPSTREAVRSAELGLGVQTQVLGEIDSAARRYYQATVKQRPYIHQDLIEAYSLLSPELAPNLSQDVRDPVQQSIINLRTCLDADRRSFGTITVRIFDFDGATLVGNAKIKVNGFAIGTTSLGGTLTFPVRAGDVTVEAISFPSSQKGIIVTIAPGESKQVDIILDESKDVYQDTSLVLNESNDGILDSNFSSFTLRFTDGRRTIPLTRLSEITLIDLPDSGGSAEQTVFLDSFFTLSPTGMITPSNLTALRNTLATRSGLLRLIVEGEDDTGAVHRAEVEFQIGRFQINVQFQAPPSNPSLSRAGILVKVKFTPGTVIFRLVTDANGSITLPKMPSGVLEVSAETLQGGRYYYGQGLSSVNSNFLINVSLLNTIDRINGVVPFTITPQFTQLEADQLESETINEAERSRRLHLTLAQSWSNDFKQLYDILQPTEAMVSAMAGSQGVPTIRVASLTVPQGTQNITLKYNVQTAEYPFYVLSQSIFNDVWSLNLETGTGQRIFGISKSVNEQLSSPPTWQSNGSTGDIVQVFNIASLTTNAPLSLSVIASATNVSDSALPTTVQACLGCQPVSVTINKVSPDDQVVNSKGNNSYYSIPRSGGTNRTSRYYKIEATKSSGSTFQSVRAQLLDESGNVLMTLFDEAVQGSNNITVVNENTLKVKVTLNPPASAVNTDPPPTNRISYRFRVTVMSGGQPAQDEKESAARKALWRMPSSFARYGVRDAGGDDWCASQTYSWLNSNSGFINFIDDISGEHAQDIGHNTHDSGEDIDVFHPFILTAPPSGTGIGNHRELRANVFAALTSPAAKQIVTQWVLVTRTRIDALSNLSTVSRLYYSEGEPAPGISSGWARLLLTTGKVTVNGQLLDLNLSTPNWSNAKLKTNPTHNSHLHIALVRN